MTPIGSIRGLASNIQWQDMIDQIMALESSRQLDPVTAKQTATQKRLDAWSGYETVVAKFRDAAKVLRDGTAFDGFRVNVATSASTDRTLLSAGASAGAVSASYHAEVIDLARAETLGSKSFADTSAALGFTGTFSISGNTVTVAVGDSLAGI